MEDILNNKFTDQVTLTRDILVPEISNYLKTNEKEIKNRAKKDALGLDILYYCLSKFSQLLFE